MTAGLFQNLCSMTTPRIVRAVVAMLLFTATGFAQDAPDSSLGALESHPHDPIVVRSRPVIERLPVSVVEPTDIQTTPGGDLLIADRKAQTVIRLSETGESSIVSRDHAGVHRLHTDRDDNVFVLSVSGNSSQIEQITPEGKHVPLCSLPFAAVAFTRDSVGEMIVARSNGDLWRVTSENAVSRFARLRTGVIDMALSSTEQLELLTAGGRVLLVTADGQVNAEKYAPTNATRLFALPEGNLATLCPSAGTRPLIARVSLEPVTSPAVFAYVPVGTVSVAFDTLGNLSLANPDLRAVTQVTSRFRVPCPHCSREVDMIFSTDAPAATGRTRSF